MQREIAPCVKIARPGFYGFGFCDVTPPTQAMSMGVVILLRLLEPILKQAFLCISISLLK